MAFKNPLQQAESLVKKVRYFKHPQVNGIWHDTGRKHPSNSNYSIYENEDGESWAISDAFAKQLEEVDEPFHPFKLDKEKYPDVEETPYGFIYNINGHSITDNYAQNKRFGWGEKGTSGFTLTSGQDDSYYPDFESAYKAAKGIK